MCPSTVKALLEFCLLLVSEESQRVLFYRSIFTYCVGSSFVCKVLVLDLVRVSGLGFKGFLVLVLVVFFFLIFYFFLSVSAS